MANRRERRALLRQAGARYVERLVLDDAAIARGVEAGASMQDLVMYYVDAALYSLVDQGADIFERTVILIGRHPDFPGALTVEAKSDATAKPSAELGVLPDEVE